MYKRSLIDIIDAVIQSMTFAITIYKVTPEAGNNYLLNVSDIFHSQQGWPVQINGKSYNIVSWTDMAGQMTLTVNDPEGKSGAPVQCEFNLYAPDFFYGTPVDTTAELAKQNNAFDKYPMFWLLMNFKEKFHDNPENPIERDSTFKIYALTGDRAMQSMEQSALNETYLKPMQKMMDKFIERVNGSWGGGAKQGLAVFDKYKLEYDMQPFLKMGVYVQNKGVKTAIMTSPLTGVECSMTVRILRPQTNNLCYEIFC